MTDQAMPDPPQGQSPQPGEKIFSSELDLIRTSIDRMGDRLEASIENLSSVEERSIKEWKRAASRVWFNVDTLTTAEVEELRLLICKESQLQAFTRTRLASATTAATDHLPGMYQDFERLGLIELAPDGDACTRLFPMAHWAVEKYDRWELDQDDERAEQWRHDLRLTVISTLLGAGLGIAGTLLGISAG